MRVANDLPPLSERQAQVYAYIRNHIQMSGYPPTVREIGAALGIRSTNGVADHLKALKRKGYLRQDGSKSRTWQVLPEEPSAVAAPPERPAADAAVQVPLLGRVAAGKPIWVEEQRGESMLIDPHWLGGLSPCFALKIVGDSMIEAGILNGDTVLVHQRQHASAGQIVVVIIDNEATVKRFYPEGDRVRLQPANQALAPLYVSAHQGRDLQIMGVVVGVYRRL